MKKLLPILSFAILLTACNTTPPVSNGVAGSAVQVTSLPDTSGLAQYQQWKAQNELTAMQVSSQPVPQAVAPVKKSAPVRTIYKTIPAPKSTSASGSSSSNGSGNSDATASSGSGTSQSSGEAKASQKKGISKAAKGAVIGGVAGAAGGAILNKKNRVVGAVIGGVVGAAGGYGIGRQMDKKDGRIEYTPGYFN
jgi:hypothetical protein